MSARASHSQAGRGAIPPLRRRPGCGSGEEGAGTAPTLSSPAPACIICDGPADDTALLGDNEGRPIAIIGMCGPCLQLADELGAGTTIPFGEA